MARQLANDNRRITLSDSSTTTTEAVLPIDHTARHFNILPKSIYIFLN